MQKSTFLGSPSHPETWSRYRGYLTKKISIRFWLTGDNGPVLVFQVKYYERPGTKVCAAFLSNNNTRESNTVKFKGQDYVLPSRSISILPDCKTVVYNTAQVSQDNRFDLV